MEIKSDGLKTTLGVLVDSGQGFIQTGPFGSQLHAHDYVEDGVPVVMPQQLGDNEITRGGISHVAEQDRDKLARHVMREGDIVFSRRGDVTRRAYVTEREDGWLCGTGCLLLRLSHPACDNRYLVRFLGLQETRSYLTQHAIGATMPNLNQGILASVPVVLPPKAHQERIVDVVAAYDDLIENKSTADSVAGTSGATGLRGVVRPTSFPRTRTRPHCQWSAGRLAGYDSWPHSGSQQRGVSRG